MSSHRQNRSAIKLNGELYTEDFDKILWAPIVNFNGAVPINELPPLKTPTILNYKAHSFVVNNEKDGRAGQHWMAVCLPPKTKRSFGKGAIFIDPLGIYLHTHIPLVRDTLWKYFEKNDPIPCDLQQLSFAVQNIFSPYCGHFCCYILTFLPLYDFNLYKLAKSDLLSMIQYITSKRFLPGISLSIFYDKSIQ